MNGKRAAFPINRSIPQAASHPFARSLKKGAALKISRLGELHFKVHQGGQVTLVNYVPKEEKERFQEGGARVRRTVSLPCGVLPVRALRLSLQDRNILTYAKCMLRCAAPRSRENPSKFPLAAKSSFYWSHPQRINLAYVVLAISTYNA
jgi:hypothetical protein